MSDRQWVDHLPEGALREFLAEMLKDVERGVCLDPLIASWRSTAEVYADPELHRALTSSSFGDYGPSEPPDHRSGSVKGPPAMLPRQPDQD